MILHCFNGNDLDTETASIPALIGMVKAMYFTSAGPDTRPFCQAVRVRMFREGEPIRGLVRHWLNTLDPPACRCGRKGTRIVAGTTFCRKCGPPAEAEEAKRVSLRLRDKRYATIEARTKDRDQSQQRDARLRALSKRRA